MTTDATKHETASESPSSRGLHVEIILAVAGLLVVGGFALPWFAAGDGDGRVSGLDAALRGGVWFGLFAVPALAALTSLLGFLRARAARYSGLATAIAMLIAAGVALSTQWPWLYTIGLVAGVVVIALGVLGRGLQASWAIGLALLAAVAIGLWALDGEPLSPKADHATLFGLALPAAIPLAVLAIVSGLAAIALVVTGVRKKGREHALRVAGSAFVGLSAYAAALESVGGALATSGIGAWMTGLGGGVLLLLSRPLASRGNGARAAKAAKAAKAAAKAAAKTKAKAAKAKAKEEAQATAETKAPPPVEKTPAERKSLPAKTDSTNKTNKTDKTDKTDKTKSTEKVEKKPESAALKAAKIEKLKKLKKLKALKALKAQEAAETRAAKAAEGEEVATAKAGEALANEPEPIFAVDPSGPPPPENEDRDALMKRVGVKKPPPPSDSELEAMLAALKNRADD